MVTCTVEVEAPCGKKMKVQADEGTEVFPETVCLECPEDNCMNYTIYHYAATHYNNPR